MNGTLEKKEGLFKLTVKRGKAIYRLPLNYIENALKEAKDKGVTKDDKEYDIRTMQAMFDKENVEPGPDSKTIGIVYRVGELMLQDKEYALAKDCFSIVYDITNEQQLEGVLAELDRCLENA